jgi:hypothetical protein
MRYVDDPIAKDWFRTKWQVWSMLRLLLNSTSLFRGSRGLGCLPIGAASRLGAHSA